MICSLSIFRFIATRLYDHRRFSCFDVWTPTHFIFFLVLLSITPQVDTAVLPDFPTAAPSSFLTEGGFQAVADAFQHELNDFMGVSEANEVAPDTTIQRLSNHYSMLAFDHLANWTFGISCIDAVPPRRILGLNKDE